MSSHVAALLPGLLAVSQVVAASGCAKEQTPGSEGEARATSADSTPLLQHTPLAACDPMHESAAGLRVATWNIKAARMATLDAIGEQIGRIEADVIGLQEVDVRTRRSGGVDQAKELSRALDMHYAFASATPWQGGQYGLVVLSRTPLTGARRHPLPHGKGEPRVLLEVELCVSGRRFTVFNHHADVSQRERTNATPRLLELSSPSLGNGSVLLGDFNEVPAGPNVSRLVAAGWADPFAEQTLVSSVWGRLDYLLLDLPLLRSLHETRHWPTTLSDHDALSVDVNWP